MQSSPFDLTPEQKTLLQNLSRRTGEGIGVLIDKALHQLEKETLAGSMDETDYLLSSPENAKRLLDAVEGIERGEHEAYELMDE
jgi:PHD/YefM family antitoxin component YafN of YafNO toxin-antitoxin module